MKTLTIALKDLTRSFRSKFALVFMFAVPLLVTGMFYLMFGNNAAASASGVAQAPRASGAAQAVSVAVANLDQGESTPTQGLAAYSAGSSAQSLGQVVVGTLQSPALAGILQVSLAPDAASARQAVESQQAAVAVIIPAGFSAGFADPHGQATVQLYQGSASQAAETVKAILGQVLDRLAGARIAASLALANSGGSAGPAAITAAVQHYAASPAMQDSSGALLDVHAVGKTAAANPMGQMLAQIMGGMLILFAFFNGGSSCESILREDEAGTLARLFSTPTRRASVLGGKFLAVGLTVLVQVGLLLAAASLVFGIRWGALLPLALSALGIVACAAAFGIFLTSLLKSTRQGGVVYGGLMTITGMLGMMTVFTGGQGGLVGTLSLLVPQGWALRGLSLSQSGASLGEVALNFAVLLALSLAFFAIGVLRFQKRYA
jgi:ABC-2 type transport system permease protein